MTYLVESGNGYAVMSRGHGYEIHQTETLDYAWCCDRGCAIRYMRAIGIPAEVITDHPLGHGAGDYIDMQADADEHGEYPTYSWGEYPCADSPSHEYCPACGSLTIHGSEDGDEYNGRSCDGSGDGCTWPSYVDPDPAMRAEVTS